MNPATTDTNAYALTAQDIKALRTCTTIVYRYHRAQEISRLEAIKEADKNNPWEQRRDVALGTYAESYEEGYRVRSAFGLLRRYSWDTNPVNTFLGLGPTRPLPALCRPPTCSRARNRRSRRRG